MSGMQDGLGRRRFLVVCGGLIACGRKQGEGALRVAAAANLAGVFAEMGKAFTEETGVALSFSYGATAQLAQQVENGAPFDVFAAADTEHVDELIRKKLLVAETRAIYGRGRLALWVPGAGLKELADLAGKNFRYIAIAKPAAAPYGRAAVQALRAVQLWEKVEAKVVYANNIQMAKQLAASGNADAAFTAYSLVIGEKGEVIQIDPALHAPLDQALAVVSASRRSEEGKRFAVFVQGQRGRTILAKHGYEFPRHP